jgi:hypothetical protein
MGDERPEAVPVDLPFDPAKKMLRVKPIPTEKQRVILALLRSEKGPITSQAICGPISNLMEE